MNDIPIRIYQNFVKAIYSKRLRFSVAVHLILRRNVDTVKPLLIHLLVRCYCYQTNLSDKLKTNRTTRHDSDDLVECVTGECKFELGQFIVAYTTTFLISRHVKSRPTLFVERIAQFGLFVKMLKMFFNLKIIRKVFHINTKVVLW